MPWTRFVLTALLATGCFGGGTPDEDDYPETLNTAYCDFLKRCSTAQFYYLYEDVDDCSDELNDAAEEYDIDYSDCDYDEDAAGECLDLYAMSCKAAGEDWDDLAEPCAEVYDCGGGSEDDEEDTEDSE